MPENWIAVAAAGDLKDESAIEVVRADQIVAIFRHRGQLRALDGMCAHQGGPLAEGMLADGCITCPWHGWQYELSSGIQTVNRQPLQRVYDVRERDGQIEIRLPEEK